MTDVTLWSRLMAGITAFREAYLSAGLTDQQGDFNEWDARRLRYELYWAFYENTAYRNVHSWATTYRQQQSLYKYIRGIYNPAYRLGEFWKAHLWGGRLDPEAGDGKITPSALPIQTDNEKLRKPISTLWKWSNWQINKQIVTLHGSILGDVVMQVIDDVVRKKVYIQPVHPGLLKSVEVDAWGNVKGYEIEETREDPNAPGRAATYKETAERDGEKVVYRTFMNGAPYAWMGDLSEWSEPYGFIPMVLVQHNNVGLDFGWSEIHSGRGKFQEADDLASKLSDQVRKNVDAAWLFSGIEKPRNAPRAGGGTAASIDNPNPGREETPVIYAPPGAQAQPLVTQLDIGATAQYIGSILAEIERDYPELQMDIWAAGKETSGRALRVARQRVTTKVEERRANYDDCLVRVQQMAISIGGYRNYEGFAGFGLDSYERGDLAHAIGERPVFAVDPLDNIETEGAFWVAAQAAIKSGLSLPVYLKRQGWAEEEINEVIGSPEYKARIKALEMASMMGQGLEEENQEGGPPTKGQEPPEEGEDVTA